MKIILSLSFYLLVIGTFGQTVIKGDLSSLPSSEYRIVTNQSSLNDYKGDLMFEGKTNDKGEFNALINLNSEQPVELFIDRFFFRLWIIPNTTLIIHQGSENEYSFSGQSEKQNTFFFQSGIMMPYTVPPTINSKTFEPKKQFNYLDSIETKRRLLFDKMFITSKASSKFDSYSEAEISHFSTYNKSQYPSKYVHIEKTLKVQDIPDNYYDFWTKFKFHEDSCLSGSYQNSLRDYIEFTSRKKNGINDDDKEKLFSEEFKTIDLLLSDRPFTMQKQKTDALLFLIRYVDFPTLTQTEIENYSKSFPLSSSLELIRKEWNKKNRNVLTVPSFKLRDVKGNTLDIKDLRGKVVYIDFWGSWCKACLEQMPNSAIVQRKFTNKDVIFLFIDFYDTNEKWLKAIKQRKLSGFHLKAEKKDEEYFDNLFGINQGFPRYALIDKNGVLITASAPHPNDEKLTAFIEQYLK